MSFTLLSSLSFAAQQNFKWAKKQLITIYKNNPQQKEFYCHCPFVFKGKKGITDLDHCGYRVRKNRLRAMRIEWEHVMPAYHFGHQLQCWQHGGRRYCRKEAKFNAMEGDLHNLQPAIGEVNGDRSNYRYAVFSKDYTQYGRCKAVTDFKNRQFQPPPEARGVIARTYLYMSHRYGIRLSRQDSQRIQIWDNKYPPSEWECKRNNLIKHIQGNDNIYISDKCNRRY